MRIYFIAVFLILGTEASFHDIWSSALKALKITGSSDAPDPPNPLISGEPDYTPFNDDSAESEALTASVDLLLESEPEFELTESEKLTVLNEYLARLYGVTPTLSEPTRTAYLSSKPAIYEPFTSIYTYYEALETDSCDPQNPEDLAGQGDQENIAVNYINDSELEAEGIDYSYYYKRNGDESLQSEHERQLAEIEAFEYTFDATAPVKKKEKTKKQKEEEARAKLVVKEESVKVKTGKEKLASDIRIVHGKSKKPINTKSKIAQEKAEKKKAKKEHQELMKVRGVPRDMMDYVLKDADFASGLRDFSNENKNEWKHNVYYDSKDENIDWETFEKLDNYEDDCDQLDKIKKYINDVVSRVQQEKKEAIAEIFNVLNHLKDGSHKGVDFMIQVISILGKEAFLVFKTLLVLVHRLNEAGLDGIKLVLETIIEGENYVLKQFEDDCVCNCECPTLKGSLLNHLDQLFFSHPQPTTTWKSDEIVEHLKQLFGIHEKPGECWCDCFCDNKKSNFFNAYSISDTDISHSPYLTKTFYNSYNATGVSLASIVEKKKKPRKGIQKRSYESGGSTIKSGFYFMWFWLFLT